MLPKEKIKSILSKHSDIEKELASGSLDPKLYSKKSKEYSELSQIVASAKSYLKFEDEKRELENIIDDKKSDIEMKNLAKKELDKRKAQKEHEVALLNIATNIDELHKVEINESTTL